MDRDSDEIELSRGDAVGRIEIEREVAAEIDLGVAHVRGRAIADGEAERLGECGVDAEHGVVRRIIIVEHLGGDVDAELQRRRIVAAQIIEMPPAALNCTVDIASVSSALLPVAFICATTAEVGMFALVLPVDPMMLGASAL